MSFPHLDLAADAHDRAGERRLDEDWLAERWADPASRALVVVGSRIRPLDGRVDWRPTEDAPDGLRVLLGERDGRTWFAVVVDPRQAAYDRIGDRGEWVGLRAVLQDLAVGQQADAPLVFHAIGLAEWLYAVRHCSRCGGALQPRAAGHEQICTACGKVTWPRTDPAVIMTVTHGERGADDERCLLGRQAAWPEGRYSTLAGFVEPGESLEDAVRREVREEVGVVVGDVDYFGNQGWPFPSSLMLGFHGRATSTEITVDKREIEDARWFTRAEMKAEAEAGTLVLPGGVSISRSLVEDWYGGPLPGRW